MSTHTWTCDHCKQNIGQFNKAKVQTVEDKVFFFHLGCYPSWKKNQETLEARRREDEFLT